MKYHKLFVTKKVFNYLIRFALLVALVAEFYYQSWLPFAIITLALILTFIPSLVEKKYNIDLPEELEIWILIFIYLTLYLGEVQKFYHIFWWWDILLHGFSAISIGFVGFIVVLYLQQGNLVRAKPVMLSLLAFSFALAGGALWEIFEFSMDQFFGFTMQDASLVDTMWDLIIDSAGAFIGALFGFIYLKDHQSFFAYTIRAFVDLNSSLFKKLNKDLSKKYSDLKKIELK